MAYKTQAQGYALVMACVSYIIIENSDDLKQIQRHEDAILDAHKEFHGLVKSDRARSYSVWALNHWTSRVGITSAGCKFLRSFTGSSDALAIQKRLL